jgi:hypothetical protein
VDRRRVPILLKNRASPSELNAREESQSRKFLRYFSNRRGEIRGAGKKKRYASTPAVQILILYKFLEEIQTTL